MKSAEEILTELALPFKPTECNFRLPMVIEAMQTYAQQLKPECEYEAIIEILKGLHKEENDKDILGFDDFNDLMKCHETQRALLVVINLLKKKLPSLPNPKQ